MRPKKGTYVFSVLERVLICVMEHRSERKFDIPFESTQKGIATLLNIKEGNVSRYLKRLNNSGHIHILKGRPVGGKRRRQYYQVTEKGYELATELKERAAAARVCLAFPSHDVLTNLYDAPSLLPGKPSMTEVITAIRNNRIDVAAFIAERARKRGGPYRASPEIPVVERFYGREAELNRIGEWYSAKAGKMLEVIGVAGIGKTTLLARAAQDWLRSRHVFWYKIQEYDTPWSVAHAISLFLSSVENAPVPGVISEREMDIGLISYFLGEVIGDLGIVFVFDDLQKASEGVLSTIKAIANIALRNRRMKVVTASRRHVKLVDRRLHMSGAWTELKLGGLDPSAAERLLSRGLSAESDAARSLIRRTGGHPLLITNALMGIAGDHGLFRYIQEEVIAGISDGEKEVLMAMALLRTPVKGPELCDLELKIEDIESLDSRNLVCRDDAGCYELHEMMKEFMVSRMSMGTRKALNAKIAEMYSSLPGELSAIEAIYHYTEAGDCKRAAALLLDAGEAIVTLSMAPRIARQSMDIAENYMPDAASRAKYFRIIGDMLEQSGDWDEASDAYRAACASDDAAEAALALTRLGELYFRKGKLDDMETAVKKALRLSERTDAPDIQGECQYSLGTIALKRGNNDEALRAFGIAVKKAQKSGNEKLLAKALLGKSRVEHSQGHPGKAIKTREKAVSLFKIMGDKRGLCKALTGIGSSYLALKNVKKAIEYHQEAAKVSESIGDVRLLAYTLANAGGAFIMLPNYKMAESNLTRALRIFEILGESNMIASICQNLSLLCRKKNTPDKALSYAERGHKIALEIGNPRDIARADAFLGESLLELKRYSEAEKYIRSALSYAMKAHDKQLEMDMIKDLREIVSRR
ncbi:MAG: tetratricopeptide repeat protein [Candidatus Thermoplasmatota archaeon]